ncbi:MAG: SAM-dependent methyltransferase [Rhodobacteraceae bacterium]|nr:SAM-dependent methyltransferase [Paracoccaceae bacterium]
MTLAQYMEMCLLHPEHGYYNQPTPIGARGGFITAPEISQMFGEMVGLALAACWQDQGSPPAFALLDLGPGRGTLMSDCLRATGRVEGFRSAARLHLFEASRSLRNVQMARLGAFDPVWPRSLMELPAMPLFAIANEFIDVLPVRQFRRIGRGWAECMVGLKKGALTMGFVSCDASVGINDRFGHCVEGDIVEIRPAAEQITSTLAGHIARHGGLLLIIDYGEEKLTGPTFQAVTDHQSADPMAAPGNADLTSHVDFGGLIGAAAPLAHAGPCPQGAYLECLGITERARSLAAELRERELAEHTAAFRRLVHPEEMGNLFKVLALYPPDAPVPPGFVT